MNKSIQDAGKVIDPTPGSQLKDLKDRLKVEIIKQRRRIRMERASAVQNNDEAEEEYEEMTDNENDCDPDDEVGYDSEENRYSQIHLCNDKY